MKRAITIFVISGLCACASFNHSQITVDDARIMRVFSIGSYNKVNGDARTDLALSAPVEGVPVRLDIGGNGFLTAKEIHFGKIGTFEYYSLGSSNENLTGIDQIIKAIPEEFFEYRQFNETN